MKSILVGSFLFLFAISFATAQEKPSNEMEAFYQNAMSQINVRHMNWIKSIAKEANEKNLSIDEIKKKAADYTTSQDLSESSQEFLIGLVGVSQKRRFISIRLDFYQYRVGNLLLKLIQTQVNLQRLRAGIIL